MKRLIVILFVFSAFIVAQAQEDVTCINKMNQARVLFNQKKYKEAKDCYEKAKYICAGIYWGTCDTMIKRCDKRLEEYEKKRTDSLWLVKEKEALNRMEKDALDRAKRRASKRLVYLTVYSDVPGLFGSIDRQLKSNLHCTNKRDEAYWFVNVMVRSFELSRKDGFYSYRIEAAIDVDNAAEWDFETKSSFLNDVGRCYVENEVDAERTVADMIYKNDEHRLYEEIVTNIKALIGLNNNIACNNPETKRNNVVIYVDYANPSIQRVSITEALQNRLRSCFSEKGYSVKSNDEKINDYIRDCLLDISGRVLPDKIPSMKEEGVDKLCHVRVVEENEYLTFYCQFVDCAKKDVPKSGSYPFEDKEVKGVIQVPKTPDKKLVEVVADVLAYQLDLLSISQVETLNKKICDLSTLEYQVTTHRGKTYNSNNTVAFFESLIVPGLGQWLKGYKELGAVTFLGEAALVCGAIYCHQMAQQLNNGFTPNTPVNIEDVNKYNSYARKCNWLVGAAVGTYAVNLVLAAALKPQNSDQAFVAPVLMPVENTVALGMGLTFNF